MEIEAFASAPLLMAEFTEVLTALLTEAPLFKDCWTEFEIAEFTPAVSPVAMAVEMLLLIVSEVAMSVGDVATAVPLPTAVPRTPWVMYLFASIALPSAKSTAAPAPAS